MRWWYIERPFPWLLILICTVLIVLAALGIWWFS
jgi:hypothetical protein